MLGAVPKRFGDAKGLPGYFLLARGEGDIAPLEMTKWFDTNYHYLVPEIGPDTPLEFKRDTPVKLFKEAKEEGFVTRPAVVGPLTFLLLSKAAKDAPEDFNPIDRLADIAVPYAEPLGALHEAGAPWMQLDEPGVTSDMLGASEEEVAALVRGTYEYLGQLKNRPQILVTTQYGAAPLAVEALTETPVEAIQAPLVRSRETPAEGFAGKTFVAGVINGRNIWRGDLQRKLDILEDLKKQLGEDADLSICTTTSLLHVPHTTAAEQWEDPALDADLHLWLAFADEKVKEVVALAKGMEEGPEAIKDELDVANAATKRRDEAEGVTVGAVRDRVANLTDADKERAPYPERVKAQEHLGLPPLPTTTIGSFPQTPEIRRARAEHAKGALSDEAYEERLQEEIKRVIDLQEELGLDVLVHGEAERNDMVQYFAELLDGFAVTKNGWVQSYGSRATRPPILWGDVQRSEPMTVKWSSYAQSLTDKPVKGMLTGPVTILAWSFVREDEPIGDVANQVGLALRDEVSDLEDAGVEVIQVDEPALREKLPLRKADQKDYLDWSVGSFRVATGGAAPETQVHTHLCYSEFGDVIDAIDGLDADVTSLEEARSHMEVLPELDKAGFHRQIGPGIYDIHSPRVPSTAELETLLGEALAAVEPSRLWVNPDCGLKTRSYVEVEPALENMVAAAKAKRTQAEAGTEQ